MNEPHDAPRFRWTILLRPRWVICIFVGLLALLRLGVEFIPTRIAIGPETTVLNGPLRADGTVDYAAAIDQQWSEGIDPEDNAVVELVRAFGPDKFYAFDRDDGWQRLGLEPNAISGPYYVSDGDVRKRHGIESGTPEYEIEIDAFNSAQSQPWTAAENPLLAEWLHRNEAALNHILKATRCRGYYSPVIVDAEEPSLYTWVLPDVQESRSATRLLCVASMHALGRGDVAEAFEYALAGHRLARLVAHNPNLLSNLVAQAIDVMATNCDAAIVLSGKVTQDQAAEFCLTLAALPEFPSIIDLVDRQERWASLDIVQATFVGQQWGPEHMPAARRFDPNAALRAVNGAYDEQVAALKLSDRSMRNNALRDVERRYEGPYHFDSRHLRVARLIGSASLSGQHFAERAPAQMLSDARLLINCLDRTTAHVRMAPTLYALGEYRARHDRFPDELAELVPETLDELPIDPYSESPFGYQRRGGQFVLYSVGENERDDGGDQKTDIVVGALYSDSE
jgi:hypothetical protein